MELDRQSRFLQDGKHVVQVPYVGFKSIREDNDIVDETASNSPSELMKELVHISLLMHYRYAETYRGHCKGFQPTISHDRKLPPIIRMDPSLVVSRADIEH